MWSLWAEQRRDWTVLKKNFYFQMLVRCPSKSREQNRHGVHTETDRKLIWLSQKEFLEPFHFHHRHTQFSSSTDVNQLQALKRHINTVMRFELKTHLTKWQHRWRVHSFSLKRSRIYTGRHRHRSMTGQNSTDRLTTPLQINLRLYKNRKTVRFRHRLQNQKRVLV